jgi:lipopolysaccharide export system protein LptA
MLEMYFMRRTRWLILAAISVIIVAVGATYYGRLARMNGDKPRPPQPLRPGVNLAAERWHHRQTDGDRPVVDISADAVQQVNDPLGFELQGVELKLYHEDGKNFDQVNTAKASYNPATGLLYSEGRVEITMGIGGRAAAGRLVKIITSGAYFQANTGKSYTDRLATFTFDQGDGKAVGAEYDPATRQLHLKSQVELNWCGKDSSAPPMKIEAGDLVYLEGQNEVVLTPWSRMQRGGLRVEGGRSVVSLQDGVIRQVDSEQAHGSQEEPGRTVQYSADRLRLALNEQGVVESIAGESNAHLASTTDSGSTDVKSERLDLTLRPERGESTLERALATGHAVVTSLPKSKLGAPPADTRVLRSDLVDLRMKPNGREIEHVETNTPSTLEFIPNRPGSPHRFLAGDRFYIVYGDDNEIQSFRALNAKTRTEHAPERGVKPPPTLTSSRELLAWFDPHSHALSRLEQNTDFRYEEGDRTAQGDKATLDQSAGTVVLTGRARVQDPNGSASADAIVLNQRTDDFQADGNVSSTRMPDQKAASGSMLSSGEPMQGKADHMYSTGRQSIIHYEGHVILWQGANRLTADRVAIDRENGVLRAAGNVVTRFLDKAKPAAGAKPSKAAKAPLQPRFTVVHASDLVYTDRNRLAHYRGGVVMERPSMTVTAREIKAYLAEGEADSSLDHAFADGDVKIVQTGSGRSRTGMAQHAEYFVADARVILEGGSPKLLDSVDGETTGKKLTYYSDSDRLLVDGVEQQRASSLIRRK